MHKRAILLDVHVQRDFFVPGGTLFRPVNATATANVYRLFDWARATGSPVVSFMILVRSGRRGPFSDTPHCIEGSGGERKLARTLLKERLNLGLSHTADLPRDLFSRYQQVIFETHDVNLFAHQKFERLVTELADGYSFVLCGSSIPFGIKQAVLGLRSRRFGVVVAEDAVVDLDDPQTEMSWLQITAKQALPLPTEQIIREMMVPPPRRRAAHLEFAEQLARR